MPRGVLAVAAAFALRGDPQLGNGIMTAPVDQSSPYEVLFAAPKAGLVVGTSTCAPKVTPLVARTASPGSDRVEAFGCATC